MGGGTSLRPLPVNGDKKGGVNHMRSYDFERYLPKKSSPIGHSEKRPGCVPWVCQRR